VQKWTLWIQHRVLEGGTRDCTCMCVYVCMVVCVEPSCTRPSPRGLVQHLPTGWWLGTTQWLILACTRNRATPRSCHHHSAAKSVANFGGFQRTLLHHEARGFSRWRLCWRMERFGMIQIVCSEGGPLSGALDTELAIFSVFGGRTILIGSHDR
jgi:hypothetical protein